MDEPAERTVGRPEPTGAALIVAEAMHGTASSDMRQLTEAVADELAAAWPTKPAATILSQRSSSFTFGP